VLSSPAALAANIVIDKQAGPAGPGIFHTHNYANDSACIQAALNSSKSGDTITISGGDYYLPIEINQTGKSLNIIGKGKVTLHLITPDRVIDDRAIQSEILFNGSQVASPNISVNGYKGSSQVVLIDASQVRQNDLIKIWKNVQWCPLDYPDQMTGEMYAVKSVNGNTITLNQPLLRDYRLSENVQIEVYRPVQIHVKNIRIEDTGATMLHHGLVLQYCKDSSVTNCWFNNSGFGDLCLYSCFNVSVNNNEMYNSIYPGSGYGINVASGSAFVNIEHNHIENCRHTITGNSDERKSLNRDVFIADNTLIGAKVRGSWVVDAHAVTINFVVTRNKIYPQLPYFYAFSDGTQQSTFSNNEIYGGYGGIFKRGGVNDGVHIYENNTFNGISGDMYRGGDGIDNMLIIRNNTQNKGTYGIDFPYKGSFRNIIISENTFSNLSYQGVYQKFLIKGVNLNISDNIFANSKREGVYIDGNSFKNGAVKIQNNILINVNTSNSSSGITVKNVQNALISGNHIFKNRVVPVAAFSASPTSGDAPLKVAFTDRSIGSTTSWKWNFGDGTSSTQMNPSHTYSKAGKYNVSLTVKNATGSNTVTKPSFIAVSLLKPPVPAFSASPLNGKAPLTVRFTDKSINNPTTWSWDFGDKTTSKVKNPIHKYTKAGKFTVKLTVKNSKSTNWVAKQGYIIVK
jgi:PKD repeat protein